MTETERLFQTDGRQSAERRKQANVAPFHVDTGAASDIV